MLLDMDGTLLDLHFDNFFWLELVPRRFAQQHEMTLEAARTLLAPRFAAKQGTLDWYCTDFWSRELSLDIAALKHEMREQRALSARRAGVPADAGRRRDAHDAGHQRSSRQPGGQVVADRTCALFRHNRQLASLRRAQGGR